jgi:hypothetical protein
MDSIRQYRGMLIPLLRKQGNFSEVMGAQVIRRVIFTAFFVWGKARHLQICMTVTKKPVTHTTHNNKISRGHPTPSGFALYLQGNIGHGPKLLQCNSP